MPSCALRSCRARYGKESGRGCSLFSFPSVKDVMRAKWIRFVQRDRRDENWFPSTTSKLCSKHFKETDIKFGGTGRAILKKGSVPCFLDKAGGNIAETTAWSTPIFIDVADSKSMFRSPRNTKFHSKKSRHWIKIKKLVQHDRRMQPKILDLKDFVVHIEKKYDIPKETAKSLKAIAETEALYGRLNKKSVNSRRKFSPLLRKFALMLHYHSPAAYKCARKLFKNVFPHIRTLRRWYVSINAEPGFTNESFRALKLKRIKSGKELICSLVFDEIRVRHQEIWNTKTNEGFVNLGFGDIRDEIASQALVFMVVSLDQNWKIPVGYFFINSISAKYKAILIKHCLTLCHDVGVKIVNITFDGAPMNLSTAEILGCKLSDPDNLQTDFPHPSNQEDVVIFFEPRHMIKLIRNTFNSKRVLYDAKNEKIKWSLLVSLNKLQANKQLHFDFDNMTYKHIQFRNQIINVRLAIQLLSRNLAKALLLCNELLTGQIFQNVSATVKFITIINDLFDILNSNKYGKYGIQQPLTLNLKNKSSVLAFLELAKDYILSLKQYIKIGQKIKRRNHPDRINLNIIKRRLVDTTNKTGFLGFLINIQSLKMLFETLVQAKRIKYLSTYRLSQDHLELFFGCIRRHGDNNNPSIKQFKTAYTNILANLELCDSFSVNCTPMDNFGILPCFSVEAINSTSLLWEENDIDFQFERVLDKKFEIDFIVNENCVLLSKLLNETSMFVEAKQMIGYISGHISRLLSKKIKCEICISELVSDIKLDFHKLITIIDMGGLCFSSKSVFEVCNATEMLIRKIIKEHDVKVLSVKHNVNYIKCKVLKVFLNSNIFEGLIIHSFDGPAVLNHRLHLIRSVIETYATFRLTLVYRNYQNKDSQTTFHFT